MHVSWRARLGGFPHGILNDGRVKSSTLAAGGLTRHLGSKNIYQRFGEGFIFREYGELDDGFKHFLFSPLPGDMIQFD